MSITIEVPKALHGERLDRVLPALVPGLSRRAARERAVREFSYDHLAERLGRSLGALEG